MSERHITNNPTPSEQPTGTTQEQVPHSGNLPGSLRETPDTTYGKPLSQAFDEQLLITPQSVESIAPAGWYSVNEQSDQQYWDGQVWVVPAATETAAKQPVETEKKKGKKGLIVGISAGIAGAAVVAASLASITYANNEKPPVTVGEHDEKIVDDEDIKVDEEPSTPESYLPSREEIEIPAGLDAEAFAQAFIEKQNNWLNEGNEDILVDRSIEANAEWTEFSTIVTKENAAVYAAALLGDEWESNPDVAPYVEKMQLANEGIMRFYVTTAWNRDQHPENIEGYYYIRSVESVRIINSSETERTIEISYKNIDNTDKNSHEPYLSSGGTLLITSSVVGDTEIITKISDIDTP